MFLRIGRRIKIIRLIIIKLYFIILKTILRKAFYMNYLIVVAHPDDEVLGAGATIYKLSKSGHKVDVCILSGMAEARAFRPENIELKEDMLSSMDLLGIKNHYIGNFPNIKFNIISHLELVQFIEASIMSSQPDIIITHHPGDTNNDHMHTFLACQAAIRLFQRQPNVYPLKELWYMEILSSTEWCVNTAINQFRANAFVEIGMDGIEKKIQALCKYRGVMRNYPHPRSIEAITGLSAFRGSQSGCNYAEAFEVSLRRITDVC